MSRTARIAGLAAVLSLPAAAPAVAAKTVDYPMPSMIYYGCVGKTKFTAKPVQ
jgi:hypothetical protein